MAKDQTNDDSEPSDDAIVEQASELSDEERSGITDELLKVTGLKIKANESPEDLTARVSKHATKKLSNQEWDELSEVAQLLTNACQIAANDGNPPPALLVVPEAAE